MSHSHERHGVWNHKKINWLFNICLGTEEKIKDLVTGPGVTGIQWWQKNSPHKGPVTRKAFAHNGAIMQGYD